MVNMMYTRSLYAHSLNEKDTFISFTKWEFQGETESKKNAAQDRALNTNTIVQSYWKLQVTNVRASNLMRRYNTQ
jgi:hypothetical protein